MSKFRPRPGTTPQQAGRNYETYFGRLFGVQPVKGSGNQWHAKLDVRTVSILFSLKFTTLNSFSFTKHLMREAEEAVTGSGGVGGDVIPAWAVNVGGEDITILRTEDFLNLLRDSSVTIDPSKSEVKRARSKVPSLLRNADD